MSDKVSRLVFSLAILGASFVQSQTVPVSLSPQAVFQSFLQSGAPNSFGCVFTYSANTNTPLATYTDGYSGTLNSNPVVLNMGGQASIWITAGNLYTFVVKSSGGNNCASGNTVATVNGVGGGISTQTTVVNYSPTPTFVGTAESQLFTLTLTGNAASLPLSVVGIVPPAYFTFQITQDVAGSHSFTWPSNTIGGCTIGQSANQVTTQQFVWNGTNATAIDGCVTGPGPAVSVGTLTASGPITAGSFPSPTITSPIINGTTMTGAPGTYYFASNGTAVINSLVSLLPASFGTAEITPAGATGQIVGIMTGTQDIHIIIQTTGLSTCLFDGPAQAPNYIQASPVVPGSCHDAGPVYPASGQVLGRVLVNISSATTAFVLLESEVRTNSSSAAAVTLTANVGAGTGASIICKTTCTDSGGQIQLTTGTSPSSGQPVLAIVFANTHLTAACTLFPLSNTSATVSTSVWLFQPSVTNQQLISGGTLTGSTSYPWSYTCSFT